MTVLIDCGVVPGLSGLLVRHAGEQLDRTERVAIRFAWNYNREYPAAIQHFLRINSGEGPQYVDGEHARMRPFEGREDVDFQAPVGRTGVYFTGVPDPVAIARFVPGVRNATAKGAFYQPEANRLMEDMVRWGFTSYGPPAAQAPSPMDYLLTFLGSPQGSGTSTFRAAICRLPSASRSREAAPVLRRRCTTRPTTIHGERRPRSRRWRRWPWPTASSAPGVLAPEAWPHPVRFLRALLEDRHIRILHWRDHERPRPLRLP